ncbi:EAL domain-containing protein [Allomesorhizobium camelthorni]|uniref:EAL domain-containing protein n=1 Tax=Allomesorhizobium camelthorni TaxID=475069 RepID=A0A6G4WK24_9HYPH|nr:EAL domain-containing protein [Mesorhizobium camelthorni]NGO54437.1 EAL domain-containing protein [Mesorhizobium camelthorni]
MTDPEGNPHDLESALNVDEVGIETGIYGNYRLKTAHQPIFRREGAELIPFAVEARVAPFREGSAVAPAEFFEETPQSDRAFVEALCRMLHLRNHSNVGIDEPERFELYLTIDPRYDDRESPDSAAHSIAAFAGEAGIPTGMVICEILDAATLDAKLLAALTSELRSHGARVSIAEFRIGQSAIDRVTQIEPDVIKIDGAWFRDVQESSETAQLFPAIINAFRGFGAKLLVQGIETPAELEAALEAGADYLQGMLLSPPALAGSALDEEPQPIEALLRRGGKVVTLGRNHHRR